MSDFLAGIAPARHLAWDAGWGSGQVSVSLAGPFERVIANRCEPGSDRPGRVMVYRCALAEASNVRDQARWRLEDLVGYVGAVRWPLALRLGRVRAASRRLATSRSRTAAGRLVPAATTPGTGRAHRHPRRRGAGSPPRSMTPGRRAGRPL